MDTRRNLFKDSELSRMWLYFIEQQVDAIKLYWNGFTLEFDTIKFPVAVVL